MIYRFSSDIVENTVFLDTDAILYDNVSGDTHMLPAPISLLVEKLCVEQQTAHSSLIIDNKFNSEAFLSDALPAEALSIACEHLERLDIISPCNDS